MSQRNSAPATFWAPTSIAIKHVFPTCKASPSPRRRCSSTAELRYLGEIFAGDPFTFEEKAPVFQTGFRWYKSPNLQWDLVWRATRGAQDHRDTF